MKVDVQELDADFYAFSGHKLFGPTGIGVLYGKTDLLNAMPPYQGGGDMIRTVTFEKTTYNDLPYKFEAGTPNIAGGIGLGAAVDYVNHIGIDNIAAYEHELLLYGTEAVSQIPGLRIIGTAREKAAVISFVMEGIHPHDIGTVLDQHGHRRPHRPPLRAAGDGPFPDTRHHPRVAGVLQHHRRDRFAGGRPAQSEGDFLLMVDDLYQETILDHSKRPRNFHAMDDANRKAEGYNPLCGDKLKLFLRVEDDIVKEASFLGAGCAISTASASLMTESLKGKTRAEALKLLDEFHELLTTDAEAGQRPRQAGGILRRARISGARQVRHSGLAHAAIRAQRYRRDGEHRMSLREDIVAALEEGLRPGDARQHLRARADLRSARWTMQAAPLSA